MRYLATEDGYMMHKHVRIYTLCKIRLPVFLQFCAKYRTFA